MLKSLIKEVLSQERKKLYDMLFIKCGKEADRAVNMAIKQERKKVVEEIEKEFEKLYLGSFNIDDLKKKLMKLLKD